MGRVASQITSLPIVYSTVYSDADERKHQSSTPLPFVRGNSPGTGEFPGQMASKWKLFPFDDIIMCEGCLYWNAPWMLQISLYPTPREEINRDIIDFRMCIYNSVEQKSMWRNYSSMPKS